MYIPALVLIIIVLLFILMRNNQIRMQLEGFSPYMGSDSSYSYIKEKRNDQQLLRCTLNKYEKPALFVGLTIHIKPFNVI